jgi:hypothetical protein
MTVFYDFYLRNCLNFIANLFYRHFQMDFILFLPLLRGVQRRSNPVGMFFYGLLRLSGSQ